MAASRLTIDGRIWRIPLKKVPGRGRLFTRLALVEGEREAELGFYLWDGESSTAISDALDLGPDWTDDGEGRRTTSPGLLTLARDDGHLDPDLFAAQARAATEALAASLR